jgi:hypothetical protein
MEMLAYLPVLLLVSHLEQVCQFVADLFWAYHLWCQVVHLVVAAAYLSA